MIIAFYKPFNILSQFTGEKPDSVAKEIQSEIDK